MSGMSFLERLLDGAAVEWKPLGEVATVTIGEFVHKNNQDQSAKYPVYNGGTSHTGFYDKYNNTGNKIIVSARGANAGFVNKISEPYWAGNSCYSIGIKKAEELNWSFVYYFLKLSESKLISEQQKGSIPAVSKKQMETFQIPIPCPDNPDRSLAIQAEIVRILDTFTALTTELTAELSDRKKQYNYYRDRLLTFEQGEVEWKPLGEEFPFIRNGFVGTVTPFFTDAENGVRYLQGTNIHNGVISDNATYYITKDFHQKCSRTELKADDILMVQSGHVGESAVVGEKYKGSNCHALIVISNGGKCNSKFVN